MRLFIIFLINVCIGLHLRASDTITIMQYNVLYYGITTDFCDDVNNNVEAKSGHLRKLMSYVQPDILGLNEMGRGQDVLTYFSENVMNSIGADQYSYAGYTNSTNSSIVNGFFYDNRKFGLNHQAVPSAYIRDINLYTLYYKPSLVENPNDTLFLTVVVAHFKAGSDVSDQQARTTMVINVMNYLQNSDYKGNLIFMGDFNMQSSYEQAFQTLINYPDADIRFHDPINVPGTWNNNASMAMYHTQSTHSGSASCFVGGGMDDRFDFILVSEPLLSGSHGLAYVENSYKAMGQDGNRFNQSLVSPANTSLPDSIIDAMYNISDHLPVKADFAVSNNVNVNQPLLIDFAIPAVWYSGGRLFVKYSSSQSGISNWSIVDLSGKVLIQGDAFFSEGISQIQLGSTYLSSGYYWLIMSSLENIPMQIPFIVI